MPKVVALIQARMGSTRFPGKVLEKIGNNASLAWTLNATRAARSIDETWIATTTETRDDVIEQFAGLHNCPFYRGSERDVLRRLTEAATKAAADIVVRITGDLPFVDTDVIDATVRLILQGNGIDYASNVDPPTWPDGLDVQACRVSALQAANKEATRPSDRDTVTQYIYRNRERWPAANLVCPLPNLENERWVLDTKEDLDFCRHVALHLTGRPGYTDILAILEKFPHYRKINSKPKRNERFYEQLATEPLGTRSYKKSNTLLLAAKNNQPYGASTYSKSAVAFGPDFPLYMTHGQGAKVFDVDGNDFIDLTAGLCTTIVGHSDSDISMAVRRQLDCGISLPLGTPIEQTLAKRLSDLYPDAPAMVAFGKNGSDVCTLAIRIARTVTNRDKIILFNDGYHGWHDWALEGTVRGHGIPESGDVQRIQMKKITDLEKILQKKQIAAIIVEPDQIKDDAYAREMARLCKKFGTLLIADEIVTFLRTPEIFYFNQFQIQPDLICVGKSLGNGMPISALIGKKDHMKRIAPSADKTEKNCFYSGTFFGETLSMAAAHATLDKMLNRSARVYLAEKAKKIHTLVKRAINDADLKDVMEIGPTPLNRLTFKTPEMGAAFRLDMAQNGILIYAMHNMMLALTDDDMRRVETAYNTVLPPMKEIKTQEKPKLSWLSSIMRR